jgi:arylsulfatase
LLTVNTWRTTLTRFPICLHRTLQFVSLVLAIMIAPPRLLTAADSLSGTRPNVIIVLVDDMGYSDLGCYGGEIDTPHIDALASGGLQFTQFYNQGRCCPTRASLMTGLQPHQVGIGHMTAPPGQPLGFEGPYQGYLNDNCVTVAEVLKSAGYTTLMTGKWHLGIDQKQCWPLQRGFDRYFGCLSGAINYFKPGGDRGLTDGNEPIEAPEGFYATDNFTDKAIRYIDDATKDSDTPFFLYLAYNAPHWPMNAKWEDYQKYRGKYKDGWRALMRARNERQRELGLLGDQTRPAEHPGPDWDSLDETQRDRLDAIMAAYAGCVDSIDQNIGKLVRHLKAINQFDNTVIFFLSDNGACQEGGDFGHGDEAMIKDPPLLTPAGVRIGLHWAGACNTPYRKYKHFVHEGGACTPMIAHWPAGIAKKDQGTLMHQRAYLQDFMATVLDLSGGSYPDGIPKCEGQSMVPLLAGDRQDIHSSPMFWEHEGNAAVRMGNWKLVREYQKPWELYDIAADRTELNDLSNEYPTVRNDLIRRWETWATETGVRFPKRFNMYEFLKEKKTKGNSKKK